MEYDSKLKDPISTRIKRGHFGKIFPETDTQQDIADINKKLAIQETKKDIEKQMFNLRMKHNAMLKSEYETKYKKLQDKWKEIMEGDINEVPSQNDIVQMVGLVNNKVKVKTLHEMLKEQSKEEQ